MDTFAALEHNWYVTLDDYFPIRVSTLRGDLKIPFDVYVRVAGKFILFGREGDSFEGARLERIKSKKLQRMYVTKEHRSAYEEYLNENLKRAYDTSKGKALETRAQVIHGVLQATADDLMEDPASEDFYRVAIEGAKKYSNFISTEPESLKHLLDIKNLDFSVSHHGVVIAGLVLAIAEELNIHNDRALALNALTVGSMIHDIEHRYNNINLIVEPSKLTPTEQKIYLAHQTEGQKRLSAHSFYDPVVLALVSQHEETIDGGGPLKMRDKDIDPIVQCLATANHFDHYITYKKLSPKEALKSLLINEIGKLSLPIMKALQDALKKRAVI